MSIAQYLWTVARDLRKQVYPGTEAGAPRDTLENSIRILTVLANALEAKAPEYPSHPSSLSPSGLVDTDRLRGPAENAAAYRDTGAALAAAAQAIASGAPSLGIAETRAIVSWEKTLLDNAIARMNAVEKAPREETEGSGLGIDPRALETYLRRRTECADLKVTDVKMILGGRSRQTALFSQRGAAGLPERLVIQRALPGLTAGPAFVGESGQFRLLEKMHAAGLKVPRPFFVEADNAALGAPFLILEQKPGRTVEPDYWTPIRSQQIVIDLARQMALLHAQPIEELAALLPHSRERYDREGWLAELDSLADEWQKLAHWPSVTVSAAIAWMRDNIDCLEDRRTLVHNDMVFHNILQENGRITAILDWEQTSIGHPGEDLGYCFPVVSASVDWNAFLGAYFAAGGPPVSQRQIDYFGLRGGLRLMNMVLKGGRDSFEAGRADNVLMASAGAYFSQHLLHRIAVVLEAVLSHG